MTFENSSSAQPVRIQWPISSLIPTVAKAHRKRAGSLLSGLGIAAGQELLLMLLWERSPQTQAELTRQLMVESPTAAKMLERLQKAGFVSRARSEVDRRVVLVTLTERGRALEGPVQAVWSALEETTTAALTAAEQEQFRDLLVRVGDSLGLTTEK